MLRRYYRRTTAREKIALAIVVSIVLILLWETLFSNHAPNTNKEQSVHVPERQKYQQPDLSQDHNHAAEKKDTEPKRTNPPRKSLIPRIIHQRWDGPMIPDIFVPWVETWVKAHPPPTWKYYFWTKEGERALIRKHFPDFEKKYDSFPFDVSRADGARVLMLERYGGVYADMDTEVIHPIDDVVESHTCFTASNQPLHHDWLKGLVVSNAVLGCKPHEPFLKLVRAVIMNSTEISKVAAVAGSFCWQAALEKYRAAGGGNITVVDPHVFIPTIDMDIKKKELQELCLSKERVKKLCPIRQKDCHRLVERNFTNFEAGPSTVTNHHWVHSFWRSSELAVTHKQFNISSIVPHALVDPILHGI